MRSFQKSIHSKIVSIFHTKPAASIADHRTSKNMGSTSGDLILVTGGTGHIGFRIVVEALLLGYSVRVAVRNEGGIKKVKAAKSVQPYLDKLSFTLVPEITAPGAYDEAVKGVKYIIHLASPITKPEYTDFENDIVQPAINGTLGILESAKKEPSVQRVVITSSIVAFIPISQVLAEDGTVFNEKSSTPTPHGPFEYGIFQAYCASKVAALHASEDWIAAEKPSFSVNNVAPAFVIGKNELVTDAKNATEGTNATTVNILLGQAGGPTPSTSVYVNDIAKMHVLALDPKIPGGEMFIGVSDDSNIRWEDAIEIVKKNFPEAVAKGIFPLGGSNETKKLIIDNSYTKKVLGVEFASYEEQVKSVAQHYIELKA